MPSLSTLRQLTLPTVGGDTGIWGGELNATINALDTILGGTVVLNSSTVGLNVTLSSSQCQLGRISYVNTSSQAAQLNIPASNGGFGEYLIQYANTGGTTGNWLTVTAGSSGTGGLNALIGPFTNYGLVNNRKVWVDGSNVFYSDHREGSIMFGMDGVTNTPTSGSKPIVIVPHAFVITSWWAVSNNAGSSGSLTIAAFNGSILTGGTISAGGTPPTLNGTFANAAPSGWANTQLPAGTELAPTLNAPSGGFTNCTFMLNGYFA